MDVGVFSYAMMTAYLGLLIDADFEALRGMFNGTNQNQQSLFCTMVSAACVADRLEC